VTIATKPSSDAFRDGANRRKSKEQKRLEAEARQARARERRQLEESVSELESEIMALESRREEIAKRLEIGSKTAENHRTRILDKLDVRNTAELVRYAMRKGLLD